MTESKRVLPKLPPMTLDEAEKEILRLEDIASMARDTSEALTIILGNLMFEFHSRGVIDSVRFLQRIRADSPNLEHANVQCAVEALTSLFLLEFEQRRTSGIN